MVILTASTKDQYASEEDGSGVFTRLLVDALNGSACNLVGYVSAGSVYAHIDESLGPWEQRPVFKTNVKNFVPLREVLPPVDPADLRRIVELFPQPGYQHPLDPSYEPEATGREPGMPFRTPRTHANSPPAEVQPGQSGGSGGRAAYVARSDAKQELSAHGAQ
jgi:hypothetical protein